MMHCKVQVTYCILVALVIVLNIGPGQAIPGECKCAGFDNEEGLNEPIIAVSLPTTIIRVSCNDDGAMICQEQCNSLGKKVHISLASTFLCQRLNKTINIPQIHLFASACDTAKWLPTEFKILKSICCNAGKAEPCNFE